MADLENLLACTVNFFSNLPLPKTLIPHNSFLTSPDSFSNSGVTTSPSLNLFKSDILIIAYFLANLALLNPRLGSLLYKGVCPPSNHGCTPPPLLAFCPFSPRPDVLPCPLPGPRPTTFLL